MGAHSNKKEPKALPEEEALGAPQPKFGQALASNDKEVREKALKALGRYLHSAHDIEELEMRKIWKALFYCMWHSDKPKVQADLAERLGALMHDMPAGKEWMYVRAFWHMMLREWTRIDRLRLNKFYMLMRCSVEHSLKQLGEKSWSAEEVQAYATELADGPLNRRSPASIRYFFADNFLPAVGARLAKSPGELESAQLTTLLDPFMFMLSMAEDDVMVGRVASGVVEPLLQQGSNSCRKKRQRKEEEEKEEGGHGGEESNDEQEGSDNEDKSVSLLPRPLQALAERLFSLASDKLTDDRNRKSLYALQQKVEAAAAAEAAASAQESQAVLTARADRGKKRKVAEKAGGKVKAAARLAMAAEVKPTQLDALRTMLANSVEGKKAAAAEARKEADMKAKKEAAAAETARAAKKEKKEKKELALARKEAAAEEAAAAAGRVVATATTESKTARKAKNRVAEMKIVAVDKVAEKADETVARKGAAHAGEQVASESFMRASKFAGAKAGYVFKKGGKGVGYYRDEPPTVASLASARGGAFRGTPAGQKKRRR